MSLITDNLLGFNNSSSNYFFRQFATDGNYFYISSFNNVCKISVSNPSNIVGTFITTGYNVEPGICTDGTYVYTSNMTRIDKWNASTGALVTQNWATISSGFNNNNMVTDGTYLYIMTLNGSNGVNGISRFKLADPTIKNVPFATITGFGCDIAICGNYLYTFGTISNKYYIAQINIATPSNVVILPNTLGNTITPYANFTCDENYLYIPNAGAQYGDGGIDRYDLLTNTYTKNWIYVPIYNGNYYTSSGAAYIFGSLILNRNLYLTGVGASMYNQSPNPGKTTIIEYGLPTPFTPPTITGTDFNFFSITVYFNPPTSNGPGGETITGYNYSIDGGSTYTTAAQSSSPIVIGNLLYSRTYTVTIAATNSAGATSLGSNMVVITTAPPPPCFKRDSKILTVKGYKKVQELKPGDLVQTYEHGFLPVYNVGYSKIQHSIADLAANQNPKNTLYVCPRENYYGMTEDLVLTGTHAILLPGLSEKQRDDVVRILGNVYLTEGHYRFPVCIDPRAQIYPEEGEYTIYHVALENDDYYGNYGIFANGILVESCSKRYLKEFSGMKLLR